MTLVTKTRRRAVGAGVALLLALGSALVVASPAQAASTWTVTDPADTNTAGTLRYIFESEPTLATGDTIVFAPGVTTVVLTDTILITVGVTIDGGGDVVISRNNNAGFTQLYFAPDGLDQDFTLKDITIQGTPTGYGSALGASFGSVGTGNHLPRDITLSGVTILNEKSAYAAIGEFFQPVGNVLIENSVFDHNVSDGVSTTSYGGLYLNSLTGDHIIIRDSTFTHNGSGYRGGAVSLIGGTATLSVEDVTFDSNSAADSGGAIYLDNPGDAVTVTGSTFTDNVSMGSGAAIGTLQLDNPLTVSTSTFTGNSSQSGGSGIYVESTTAALTIQNSTFAGNPYAGAGTTLHYGISVAVDSFASGGSVTIQNVTADERTSASNEAAVWFGSVDGPVAIRSSTLAGPTAAVGFGSTSSGPIAITNSVLEVGAAVLGVDAVYADNDNEPVVVSYSASNVGLDATIVDGGGNQFNLATLGLAALDDNGGPTETRLPQPGSPLINAGNPAGAAPLTLDQRGTGYARVVGGRVDIGAVETTPALAATGSTVPWWMIAVAFGVVLLGALTLLFSRRARAKIGD